jgi:oligoribonuclease NrnB/cAMP/cGMP phosphodiesterase (DHH superfamily)
MAVRAAHPDDHVQTVFADYSNVDKQLLRAMIGSRRPDRIVLADICFAVVGTACTTDEQNRIVNNELPAAIKAYVGSGGELVVLDHHPRVLEVADFYKDFLHPDSICETKDANGVARAGSEQAARYYFKLQSGKNPSNDVAIKELCELAGDYDVWRNPLGFGGKLAIASELMSDPYQLLSELTAMAFYASEQLLLGWPSVHWPHLIPDVLGTYLERAEAMFEDAKAKAIAGGVRHHKFLTEIHTDFFPSLISMAVYEETRGVVLVRYEADRTKSKKFSLRRHADFPLDLNAWCKAFVDGGGHPVAAGFRLKSGQTVDEAVSELVRYVDLAAPEAVAA